ncbi:MAG: hypothetical protein CM1200mP30_24180 [Pseudomonadota bacterium]|nr:MAG: hypothetical protein CM1200mP30_24180 [Pseudomonadota bacterium]
MILTEVATGLDFASALVSGRADAPSAWESMNWGMLVAGGIPKDQVSNYKGLAIRRYYSWTK